MDRDLFIHEFIKGTGISPFVEGDISFGNTCPQYAAAGVEAVMKVHTATIDSALELIENDFVLKTELFHTRGFTMSEYRALFDVGIREKDFYLHPAIRSLFITSENERRKIIYKLDKDSFDDYYSLLTKYFKKFNLAFFSFFFRAIACRKISFQFLTSPYTYNRA